MEQKICQSCGMPMSEDQYGKQADGKVCDQYCIYCYQDGKFAQECTMEEMADFCAPFQVEAGISKTVEEGKEQLMSYFPTLERWKV